MMIIIKFHWNYSVVNVDLTRSRNLRKRVNARADEKFGRRLPVYDGEISEESVDPWIDPASDDSLKHRELGCSRHKNCATLYFRGRGRWGTIPRMESHQRLRTAARVEARAVLPRLRSRRVSRSAGRSRRTGVLLRDSLLLLTQRTYSLNLFPFLPLFLFVLSSFIASHIFILSSARVNRRLGLGIYYTATDLDVREYRFRPQFASLTLCFSFLFIFQFFLLN